MLCCCYSFFCRDGGHSDLLIIRTVCKINAQVTGVGGLHAVQLCAGAKAKGQHIHAGSSALPEFILAARLCPAPRQILHKAHSRQQFIRLGQLGLGSSIVQHIPARAALQDDMAHRAACGLQHRVTEAVAGDVLFAVQQDEAHAVAAVRPQEAVGDVGHAHLPVHPPGRHPARDPDTKDPCSRRARPCRGGRQIVNGKYRKSTAAQYNFAAIIERAQPPARPSIWQALWAATISAASGCKFLIQ